jgi:hydrogenase-4 transcriptional activator
MALQLQVWREVCRHIEIDEAVERLAPIVAKKLPIDRIVIRRLDLDGQRLETLAVGRCRPGPTPDRPRSELTPAQIQRVADWASHGKVHAGDVASSDLLAALVPHGEGGSAIVGPLAAEDGPIGLVALIAHAPGRLTPEHAALAQDLLEPLAVALANDQRVHELARLREAVEADNRALLSRLERQDIAESVVGAEAGLRDVMRRVDQVAPTNAPVLIFGETGSGKEVLARAIHGRSRRASGPIVRVNCGAIPPELVDSELFGHERGSFTGAVATRKGWFERADGGTLFLDEVGELPPAAQVRLLRVLQDGTFERVGGQRPLSVDVRVVAATHRDLQRMVGEGTFREDLWYRLGVFPIRLPPLRERVQDIPPLAAHFAIRAGRRLIGQPLVPTPDDIDRLLAYDWPGNVRELAAVIERAAILGDGKHLDVARALGTGQSAPAATPRPTPATGPIATLDEAMLRHIEAALVHCKGRIEGPHGAAAVLGINPHTLRSRMRKQAFDWSKFR